VSVDCSCSQTIFFKDS